jgi:chromate transporter
LNEGSAKAHDLTIANATPNVGLVPCTLRDLAWYFLRLGTVGFGGPIALAGYMQKDLVEDRRWLSKQDYVEGLALAQLAPGPLAAQLAMYLGWVRGGVPGATLIGFAFVIPSFSMVLILAALYIRFGGLPWMRGAFYGIGAAVIAIIGRSVVKLVKMTLGKDRLLWGLFFLCALVTAWTESEIVWVFLASGVITMAVRAKFDVAARGAALGLLPLPLWSTAGLAGTASAATLWTIAWYFAEAGAFVFGSGLAIVPFLHGGVVTRFHWLDDQQFLDAVAVAMITPGPVVITVAFIGFLVAGVAGASVAALATFGPCYLFTVLPAPYFRLLQESKHQGIRGRRKRSGHRSHRGSGFRVGAESDFRRGNGLDRGNIARSDDEIQKAPRTAADHSRRRRRGSDQDLDGLTACSHSGKNT